MPKNKLLYSSRSEKYYPDIEEYDEAICLLRILVFSLNCAKSIDCDECYAHLMSSIMVLQKKYGIDISKLDEDMMEKLN